MENAVRIGRGRQKKSKKRNCKMRMAKKVEQKKGLERKNKIKKTK